MESELQLLNAIRAGDRQALRRLYDRFAGYAMAVGLRYVPQADDVRDVVQDSFVKILTSIGRVDYRGEGTLKSWVARIVANQAIDFVRKRERLSFISDVPDCPDEPPPDVETLPPEVLTTLISQLPTGYRLVLNLYVFEQCPHKEIARRLGISESTSASQFARAKKMLARMVKDYLKQQER